MCSAQVTISCSNPSLLSVPEPEVTKPKELGSIRWPQSRVRRGWPLVAVCVGGSVTISLCRMIKASVV